MRIFYDFKVVENLTSIQAFPDGVCKNSKDKQAVLCHLACADALHWMTEMVGYILGVKS